MWGLFFTSTAINGGKIWKNSTFWEKIGKKVEENLEDAFQDVEKEFDKVGKDLEGVLEDLEFGEDWENTDWDKEISDEEFEKVLRVYEELIGDYTRLADKAASGDVTALAEYAKVSAKAIALATKITSIAPRLTPEQHAKFEELQEKYKEALEKTEELEK
jgi:hypothetical protein